MLDIQTHATLNPNSHEKVERLAYTIPDASAVSGIGRTAIYELIGSGELTAIKIGRRTLVTAASLRRLIESAPKADIRPTHRRSR